MFLTPAGVVLSWFRGLLSVAILIGAIYLGVYWYRSLPQFIQEPVKESDIRNEGRQKRPHDREEEWAVHRRPLGAIERIGVWNPGMDAVTAALVTSLMLCAWGFAGRYIHPLLLLTPSGGAPPQVGSPVIQRLTMSDGSELHTELRGTSDCPTVVLTHGWSLSSREWTFLEQHWQGKVRTVVWDLPGLGQSSRPANDNYSLEQMAHALRTVIDARTNGPVILVGHSIGGMIILTFCRLYPELLGTRVSKLVLIHTSYINPLRTMRWGSLFTALQKPLVEPLLHLQIICSPLVSVMNWLSYWNGTIHSSVLRNGYGSKATRQKIDFVAAYYPSDSPAVIARGALAMLDYDATAVLASIPIPALVIGAREDPITLNSASEVIHSRIPGSSFQVLEEAKHFGLLEYDQVTATAIADFCST